MEKMELAKYFDHTILKPDAKVTEVEKICKEALEYAFASVCINPTHVVLASKLLANSEVKVCTVIGFPLGASTTETKAFEAKDAIIKGASEIDMVINIGAIKSGNWELVEKDIHEVSKACGDSVLLKVIFETCLLTDEEKVKACHVAEKAGADYVKTSTGFSTGGATESDVALMRKSVAEMTGVKASGAVRDLATTMKMIKAGATRIGSSSSVAILKELDREVLLSQQE